MGLPGRLPGDAPGFGRAGVLGAARTSAQGEGGRLGRQGEPLDFPGLGIRGRPQGNRAGSVPWVAQLPASVNPVLPLAWKVVSGKPLGLPTPWSPHCREERPLGVKPQI